MTDQPTGRPVLEQRPASDLVIADLRTCVEQVRDHEHPNHRDYYCFNITAYMGERMGGVLKRLADTQAEVRSWRDRNNALADEATGYLDRISELELELAQARGEA